MALIANCNKLPEIIFRFFSFPMVILGHTLGSDTPICGSKQLYAAVETRQRNPESLYDTMMDISGNRWPVCRSWLISQLVFSHIAPSTTMICDSWFLYHAIPVCSLNYT